MKKLILILLAGLLSIPVFSQTEVKLDTIYMLGQRKKLVKIKGIMYSDVVYSEPGSDETKTMEKKQIQRVVFHNGRLEVFNEKLFAEVEESDYKNVVLTENKNDVKGLYNVGKVHGESSERNRTARAAQRTATIRMKRRAANKQAEMILVTKKELTGGFGEVPSYYMEGIAYSFDKPKKKEK